jgi:hypothetical protein
MKALAKILGFAVAALIVVALGFYLIDKADRNEKPL